MPQSDPSISTGVQRPSPERGRGGHRRFAIGAELLADGAVSFRVWAPDRRRVEVVSRTRGRAEGDRAFGLKPEPGGYFSGVAAAMSAGDLYSFRLDGESRLYPDPASRFQPEGPHGPSQVIDPSMFVWTDQGWPGVSPRGQVIYEMHVGTFTPEGTFQAARRQLAALRELGVTVIELMPLAEFPGSFGWGYDGVDLWAPTRLYGQPDDLRQFVDEAHRHGLGVSLDVVYNHLGPDGNYLKVFSRDYFTDRYRNEWGEPVNFDGDGSAAVREFFIQNATYWIEEFHLDGLRIDATQSMFDSSPDHVLAAITRAVRAAASPRRVLLVAENEPQETRVVRALDRGGYGLDALWNDDFHHSARVAATGRNEAYYTDYRGTPQELLSAIRWGYLYQGQHYRWQKKRRGSAALDLEATSFVYYIQNHDQIANSGRGLRLHELTSPGRYRALTALTLLTPGTPMLFQGQEFAASAPFVYFADHGGELAKRVCAGRNEFLQQFPSLASEEMATVLPDPCARETFDRCKLDHRERERHASAYALHRDLLALRRSEPVFQHQRRELVHGAVLAHEAFVLRYLSGGAPEDDRLLIVNLGPDLHLDPSPEPLLAPIDAGADERGWETLWSSEHPRYGGTGTPPLETEDDWQIPAHAAIVLRPKHGGGGER